MAEDSGRGWRKVVASPLPQAIRGVAIAAALVNRGHIVVAAGRRNPGCRDRGRAGARGEAVIDKDYTASLLATSPPPRSSSSDSVECVARTSANR
jgi:carbamate kinase